MAPATKVNGVNIDQLFSMIDLLKEKPELAKFKFRATNKWLGGTHSRATVKDFYGPGKEDTSRPAVSYDLDEPEVLLRTNQGTNPVEYLLVALSGCITTALVAYASASGEQLAEKTGSINRPIIVFRLYCVHKNMKTFGNRCKMLRWHFILPCIR